MKKEITKVFILENDENLKYLHTMLIKSIGIKTVISSSNLTDAFIQLKFYFNNNNFPDLLFIDLDLPDDEAIKFLFSYEDEFGGHFPEPKIILFSDFQFNKMKELLSFKSILTQFNKPLLRADFLYFIDEKKKQKSIKRYFSMSLSRKIT